MSTIKETTLHPDGNEGVDLYPKTNINQVQELPQKLTSIENQIGQLNINKLTKPVTPTAESAVTMLADGTVGTKPLSEIGGSGGGKLYVHSISINTDDFSLSIVLYKSDNSEINTIDKLFDTLSGLLGIPFHYISYRDNNHGFVEISMTGQPGVHALTVIGVVTNLSGQVNAVNMSNVNTTTIRDAVIEV